MFFSELRGIHPVLLHFAFCHELQQGKGDECPPPQKGEVTLVCAPVSGQLQAVCPYFPHDQRRVNEVEQGDEVVKDSFAWGGVIRFIRIGLEGMHIGTSTICPYQDKKDGSDMSNLPDTFYAHRWFKDVSEVDVGGIVVSVEDVHAFYEVAQNNQDADDAGPSGVLQPAGAGDGVNVMIGFGASHAGFAAGKRRLVPG